jgi:N-acetylglutamate synthase-like GNAT family acetyltransferase
MNTQVYQFKFTFAWMDLPEIEIVDYRPEHAKAFYDLNIAWIEAIFVVEQTDRDVLEDPQKYILDKGGAILIALYNGNPVGTCALKRVNNDVVEMTKMTVASHLRGKKIGYLLGKAIIEKAKQIGARTLILYSNRKGSAKGIELYRQLGFEEVPLVEKAYDRADIKMSMNL